MKIKTGFLVFNIIFTLFAQGQDSGSICFIKHVNEIYWFGHDVSQLTLTQPSYKNDPEGIKQELCPQWSKYLNLHFSINAVNKMLNYSKVIDLSYDNIESYQKIITQNFIHSDITKFDTSKFPDIVKCYKKNISKGTGFVIIWDNFIKYNETASGYFVFFNIETSRVLFFIRISGNIKKSFIGKMNPSIWGPKDHIPHTMLYCVKNFKKYLSREIKKCK